MSLVERYESRAEVPLVLLTLAFLVAYGWPVLAQDRRTHAVPRWYDVALTALPVLRPLLWSGSQQR